MNEQGEANVVVVMALSNTGALMTAAPIIAVLDHPLFIALAVPAVLAAGTAVGRAWVLRRQEREENRAWRARIDRALFGEWDKHGRQVEEGAIDSIKRMASAADADVMNLRDHLFRDHGVDLP